MNLSDVVALAKAGFNAEQIAQLANLNNAPTPAPTSAPTPAPTPAPAPAPAPTPAPDPAPAPAPAEPTAVEQKLDILTQLLQGSNIINSQQPHVETADEILASIINPTYKEGK